MLFYLVICRTVFYVFEKNGDAFDVVHIDGNPYTKYNLPTIRDDILSLTQSLTDIYNLESSDDLKFVVVENIDRVRNLGVSKTLGDKIERTIPIMTLISQYIANQGDEDINRYGINYDGDTYMSNTGGVTKHDYSLLGIRIEVGSMINFVERV
ncbi:hypothetical protein [Mitsuokella jalaludinii]|uniref:hypothetical protein n=1 Tax=Mitsuokella jalaludinii TaxID=187979 RepID=UPI000562946D|nr:hypothetical protein [Mitsuokella jalaludinii]